MLPQNDLAQSKKFPQFFSLFFFWVRDYSCTYMTPVCWFKWQSVQKRSNSAVYRTLIIHEDVPLRFGPMRTVTYFIHPQTWMWILKTALSIGLLWRGSFRSVCTCLLLCWTQIFWEGRKKRIAAFADTWDECFYILQRLLMVNVLKRRMIISEFFKI